jgi:dihydroneopterin aldolase
VTEPTLPDRREINEGLAGTVAIAQRILVRGFCCAATIGVSDEERATPQRLGVDVELELSPDPPVRDDIDEVLNYGKVVRLLRHYCIASEYRLLETLADALASAFFSFERVGKARIRIVKLDRYPEVDRIGIEIERERKRES